MHTTKEIKKATSQVYLFYVWSMHIVEQIMWQH